MKLEYYKSLSEVKEVFDVEYIDNSYNFNCLIEQLQKEENSLYRGVSSPRFKMYSSAQRFYLDNKESLFDDMSYPNFLKKLYEISKELRDGELLSLYDKVKNDNYVQYVNTDMNVKTKREPLDYNPIWAFHTLQHLTECSPFLDFSKDFYVALYFAAQKISPVWCDNFSKSEIDNYIEIISIANETALEELEYEESKQKKYSSLITEIMANCNNVKEAKKAIATFDISQCKNNVIRYICFKGNSNVLIGKGVDYKFSFENANCEAQFGRLYLTSIEENKTFEQVWNDVFKKSPKLKAYLIHKSLATDIFQSLTNHLLGKMLVPIQKDYKDEIKELIIKNNK